MHSHLLWLGLFADSMGFENLFMNAWRLREHILTDLEETTGGRVIQGSCKIGGVRCDIANDKLAAMRAGLHRIEPELREITRVFLEDETVELRTKDVGVLSREQAWDLGAVGPVARGSGIELDARMTGYGAYHDLDFKPVTASGGDCFSRCKVRVQELFTSMDLITQAIEKIPDGDIEVPVRGNPDGEFFSRTEQPRGEVVHYIKAGGTKNLLRHRVRTPTTANIPSLVTMLAG